MHYRRSGLLGTTRNPFQNRLSIQAYQYKIALYSGTFSHKRSNASLDNSSPLEEFCTRLRQRIHHLRSGSLRTRRSLFHNRWSILVYRCKKRGAGIQSGVSGYWPLEFY
jgi:hypothetical protein